MRLPDDARRYGVAGGLALLLGASAVLAALPVGPTGTAPSERPTGRQTSYQFLGTYAWRAPVATNGAGQELAHHPLLDDQTAFPHAVQRMLPTGGAEPSIGVTSTGSLFVVTFDRVQRSRDHGATWQVVHDFVTPNFPRTVDRFGTFDPTLWVDPDTDRIYVDHLTVYYPPVGDAVHWCTALYYSDDEGDTWSPPLPAPDTTCDVPIRIDHPKIVTGRAGPGAVLDPRGPVLSTLPDAYPNVFYLCGDKERLYTAQLGTWCAVSYDGGRTFAYTRPVLVPESDDAACDVDVFDPRECCPGLNGQPAVYADGTVVVPLCGGPFRDKNRAQPVVGVSEDSGLTWAVRTFSGSIGQVEVDPDVTVTADGVAYYFFRGLDQQAYLLRSRDKFETWEGPFRVSPPDHTLDAFAAIAAGSEGRLVLAYLGTRDNQTDERRDALPEEDRPPREPSNAVRGTRWHLFVTTSLDANSETPTFVTQQVTPEEDPVQVGCIGMYGGGSGCRNLLDFIDVARDPEGRFFVALTDGCTPRNGCTTDPDAARFQSDDSQVSVAVQVRGLSLFSNRPLLTDLAFEPPGPIPH